MGVWQAWVTLRRLSSFGVGTWWVRAPDDDDDDDTAAIYKRTVIEQ